MNLKPLNRHLLFTPLKKTESASGILLSTDEKNVDLFCGKVTAVAEDCQRGVKVDQYIIFGKRQDDPLPDTETKAVHEGYVHAIIVAKDDEEARKYIDGFEHSSIIGDNLKI